MALDTDALRFARQVDQFNRRHAELIKQSVNDAGTVAAKATNAAFAAATGGDRRLSGLGTARWLAEGGVKIDAKARPSTAPLTGGRFASLVVVDPPSAASIVEYGAARHVVGAGRNAVGLATDLKTRRQVAVKRRRDGSEYVSRVSAKRKLLNVAGNPRYGPFVAGGSPAKHPLERAVAIAGPAIRSALTKGTGRALKESFR